MFFDLRSGIGDPTAKGRMVGKQSNEVNAVGGALQHSSAFSWRSGDFG
jgi:hypothetical protein